jgi:hypothetical protein
LTSILQNEITDKPFSQLSDIEKTDLQQKIENRKKEISSQVNKITSDVTYQSWIYDLIINKSVNLPEDSEKLEELLNKYTINKRKPDFPSDGKNINRFKSFGDLWGVVENYINKDSEEIDEGMGNNKIIYNNSPWMIVELNNFNESQCITKKSGWCIKGEEAWNDYKPPFFVLYYRGKKFGLVHFETEQIKDISDEPITRVDDPKGIKKAFDWLNKNYNNNKDDWKENSDIFRFLLSFDKEFRLNIINI